MHRPRLFSSTLSARQRLVYGLVTLWFCAVAAALIWPVYGWFAGIHPLVLGIPLSLAYLVTLTLTSFAVGLALYLWEDRQGVFDEPGVDESRRPGEGER